MEEQCRYKKDGYCGYSQETMNALTADRDQLQCENIELIKGIGKVNDEGVKLRRENAELKAEAKGWYDAFCLMKNYAHKTELLKPLKKALLDKPQTYPGRSEK